MWALVKFFLMVIIAFLVVCRSSTTRAGERLVSPTLHDFTKMPIGYYTNLSDQAKPANKDHLKTGQ
jgi:hypothetical protein